MVFTATNALWLIVIFSVFFLLVGFFLGLFFSSLFDVALKVGSRNQMEFYAKEMNKRLEDEAKEGYKRDDLFPPTLDKDYGVPRELK